MMVCPFCDGPIHADPLLPGALVCANPGCESGPVIYQSVIVTAEYPSAVAASVPSADAAFEEASPHLAGLLGDVAYSIVKVREPRPFLPV